MIITTTGNKIEQQQYKDEAELQALIFEHPELLSDEGSELISIMREMTMKTGDNKQRIDVLAITSSGIITLVEVKLARNSQSRREVLAQIFDYISELSDYSYYELDQATNGNLSRVVDGFENSEELPRTIENSLKNGQVRLIIAVDESNNDLHRLVEFVAEHTDLRVDLVEVKKFINNGEFFYSSNPIVQSSFLIANNRSVQPRTYPLLERVVMAWKQSNPPFPVTDNHYSYRQIRMNNWPAALHYEFTLMYNKPIVYIRLDNELYATHPQSDVISNAMEKFVGAKIEGYELQIRPYTRAGSGRILYIPLPEADADKAPLIMSKLIELTKNTIDSVLGQN